MERKIIGNSKEKKFIEKNGAFSWNGENENKLQ